MVPDRIHPICAALFIALIAPIAMAQPAQGDPDFTERVYPSSPTAPDAVQPADANGGVRYSQQNDPSRDAPGRPVDPGGQDIPEEGNYPTPPGEPDSSSTETTSTRWLNQHLRDLHSIVGILVGNDEEALREVRALLKDKTIEQQVDVLTGFIKLWVVRDQESEGPAENP